MRVMAKAVANQETNGEKMNGQMDDVIVSRKIRSGRIERASAG